jgi:5'-AMP-activated protein kinase regulatory beta subunit
MSKGVGNVTMMVGWLVGCMVQVPMVPIPKADEMRLGGGGYQQAQGMHVMYNDPSLYGEPEKGVATMIVWSHGGSHVSVIGSWDNWTTR